MFGNFKTADLIAWICACSDNQCRHELRPRIGGLPGEIKSERDYVSSLLKDIRTRLRPKFACLAEVVDQGTEIRNGADGLILFQFGDEVKAGWFEAKWPRVNQANYPWDGNHDTRLISHFSEQILKQRKRSDNLAIWEMFFNEADDGYQSPPFCAFGSSCVWHENAFEFMKKEGIIYERWTTDKLKELLRLNCTNFYSIIYDIISCQKGKKIKIAANAKTVSIENPRDIGDIFNVPLPEAPTLDVEKKDERISAFLKERKIEGYLYINLEGGNKI